MEKITYWTQITIQSMTALGEKIMTELPKVLGAIFLIILGWLIAKLLFIIVRKTLKLIHFDKLSEKINVHEVLAKANIEISPSEIIAKFIYWVILLLFFVTASDTLGWTVVSESISDLLIYLPKLFSGIIIFIIGLYIANIVRSGLQGIFESISVVSGKIISTFAFYLILIIITLTALNQAGVDTTIITSNVTLIIGGIILAFAISFGFGSREILTNILSSFYSRKNFQIGQEIEINGLQGTIEKIDNISCVISTKTGKMVIPVSHLLNQNVLIKKQGSQD